MPTAQFKVPVHDIYDAAMSDIAAHFERERSGESGNIVRVYYGAQSHPAGNWAPFMAILTQRTDDVSPVVELLPVNASIPKLNGATLSARANAIRQTEAYRRMKIWDSVEAVRIINPVRGNPAVAVAPADKTVMAPADVAVPKAVPAVKVTRVRGQDEARKIIETAVALGHNIMLEGHTGTGKTTILQEIAHDHGCELVRVNLNGQTGKEDFVGQHLVRAGVDGSETYFAYGILIDAMKTGKWLVCDEINAALPEILFVLQSVLDDARAVRLTEHNGEVIVAHPDFRFFGTMNPTDEYAGTKELNAALKSRFGTWVHMGFPPSDVEQQILMDRTSISAMESAMMVQVAQIIRNAKDNGLCYANVSTRDLLRWAELSVKLDNRALAFKYTILNRAGLDVPFLANTVLSVDKDFGTLLNYAGKRMAPKLILAELRELAETVKTAKVEADQIVATARDEARSIREGIIETAYTDAESIIEAARLAVSEREAELQAKRDELDRYEKDMKDRITAAVRDAMMGAAQPPSPAAPAIDTADVASRTFLDEPNPFVDGNAGLSSPMYTDDEYEAAVDDVDALTDADLTGLED